MIVWDPPTTLFTIPFVNLEVRLYGVFFALGFLCAYYLVCASFKNIFGDAKKAQKLTDRLTSYSVIGCVLGARLGHVLFYDWEYYSHYPLRILAVWEGGLASHGGAIGVFIAILLFWKHSKLNLSFLQFFDLFVVPVALVAFFIRLGNFFNQEILGDYTTLPWGVVFSHAIDGGNDFARHPVQLYEGLFYLATFLLLKNLKNKPQGFIAGLFLILIFSSRFLFEFLKSSQGGAFDDFLLQTG
jgi:prolipoprotein diacylglyceryl transferase